MNKYHKLYKALLGKPLSRREFFTRLGLGAAFGTNLMLGSDALAKNFSFKQRQRSRQGQRMHNRAATKAYKSSRTKHINNGEEKDFNFLFNYSKSLPHNSTTGEVDTKVYERYLNALEKRDFLALENIATGFRPLENPQAGLVLPLDGMDHQTMKIPPAPRVDSAENSAEMIELYWQALCRDIPFSDYETDTTVGKAIDELNTIGGYTGPTLGGQVTPKSVFRGSYAGDLAGPYISQFLLQDISFGSHLIQQKLSRIYPAGSDSMKTFDDWLFVQQGNNFKNDPTYDSTARYIRNGRDLASYVYEDELFQPYLNATAWMLDKEVRFDSGNPYHRLSATSGYITFGPKRILVMVCEVALLALQAMFFQKWMVHRRQRPEEFGGRIHQHVSGSMNYPMIHDDVLNSNALADVFSDNGTYFLPQVYREGSPTHPSYGAGHATVAGACVTILKAFFDESYPVDDPVVANADGTALENYTAGDRNLLTVGGELNKLAANIAIGRNWAGIHWRSDYVESLKLGERVAIRMLRMQAMQYPERHTFNFHRFDGSHVSIEGRGFAKT
ncbi:MAG: vanadium-dependent haloperoxidase [Bdellovibrionota bacterium]